MPNQLSNKISQYWHSIQSNLFPWLTEELGPLSAKQQELVNVLEFSRIEDYAKAAYWNGPGRPSACRQSMARAFVAKAVYNLATTRALIGRLNSDRTLRRLCGWERRDQVPKEWSFSRAFAEFASNKLGEMVHQGLVKTLLSDKLFGHVSRDATAIEAREKAMVKTKPLKPKFKRPRGRPKKSDCSAPKEEPKRIERQLKMTCLSQMLADLPTGCDTASKVNAKGYKHSWRGYKLHIDTVDGDIPVSCILTSASTHDSQVAIPLATMTQQRITNCYDLMDAAYDSGLIRYHSLQMGHVPLIDFNRRSKNDNRCFDSAQKERYKQRSSAERTNGSLKDNYNGSSIRVKGHAKVMAHLMFGVLALTVVQIIRLLH